MKFFFSAFAVVGILLLGSNGVLGQLSCYSCDSDTDSNCATLQVLPASKTCDGQDESQCVVTILGRRTVRGCKSEVELIIDRECNEATCGQCTSDLCNSMIWPEYRIQCHKCSTCDYIENNSQLEVCENYLSADSCYVVVDQIANPEQGTVEIVSHRGCFSTSGEGVSYCLANPGKCLACSSTGCNSQPSYTESALTCYKCDSTTDSNCVVGQGESESQACEYNKFLGVPESCYTYVKDNGDVTRGCLLELAASNEIRQQCEGNDEKCKICSGPDCNVATTEEEYGKCVVCDGTTDPNCEKLEGPYTVANCGPHEIGGCVRSNIDGYISRYCVSDLQPGELSLCQRGVACKICQGDLCNAKVEFPVCHQCDSTTDPNCVDYQTDSGTTCNDYGDSCAAFIDFTSGATIRGCAKELEGYPGCNVNANYCAECERNYCNAAPIPWFRIKCHQCSGLDCAITSLATSKYCSNYKDDDQCYSVSTIVNGEARIYRGCLSDVSTTPGLELCAGQGEFCTKCSSSECNSNSYTYTSQLSCHVCDSTTDPNCDANQASLQSTRCGYEVGLGTVDKCYKYFDGTVIQRGCLYNAPNEIQSRCARGSEDCELCEGAGCNSAEIETNGRCYDCDGTVNSNCESLTGVASTYCPLEGRKGCFRSQIDGKVVRGCVSKLSSFETTLCETGNVCKICDGDNCNGKLSFQSCYSCNSADHEDCALFDATKEQPKKTCLSYLDQCVTYFNNGVVHRDCAGNAEITCPSGSCTVCSGNDCNTSPPVVASELSCHICDSTTDPNCAADQSTSQSTLCPYSLVLGRVDQCYEYDEGGKVMRGCLYNAPFEVQTNCLGNSADCKLCSTSGCNSAEVVESERCYKCDGTSNSNCASLTGISSMKCPAGERGGCFRSQIDGFVSRGCVSELTAGEVSLCQRGQQCKICEGDNCNGKLNFQSCYSCDTASNPICGAMNSLQDIAKKTCTDYLDDCVTYFDNGVVYRGCHGDADVTCPSGSCTVCLNEDCNTQPPIAPSTLSCHICDTTSDPSCQNDQTNAPTSYCPYSLVIGRPDECYQYYDGEKVSRGCLYNAPFEVQMSCAGSSDECQLCSTSGCNSAKVETNGICYSCDGTEDPKCESLSEFPTIMCPAGDRQGCFHSQIDGVVSRGCVSQLNEGEVNLCEAGVDCKICEGDKCNWRWYYHSCYDCNSEEDVNCLEPRRSETPVKTTTCKEYHDECATFTNNGITYRGCTKESDLPSSCPSNTCISCTEKECNGLVFPFNRLRCNQCVGSTEQCFKSLVDDTTQLALCKNYVAGEACYTTITSDRQTAYRGCMSDNDEGSQLCSANGESTCKRCTGFGCNTVAVLSSPSLSCVVCSSAASADCAWGYSASEANTCRNDIWLGETESCYRVQSSDGTTQRGCTLDDTNQCPENGVECEKCSNDGCNTKTYNKHKCYQCDSKVDGQSSCAEEAEDILITECPGDDQKLTDIGCYLLKQADGSVKRGCMTNIDADLIAQCKSEDNDLCEYCAEDGCNDQNAGAAALKALSVILVVAVAGFRSVFN